MSNKTLIITGADGALGTIVAKKLLNDGWALYASALNEKSKTSLEALFSEQINNTLFVAIADLSDAADVKNFVASAPAVFGLVHLAGGYKEGKSISDYSVDDFEDMMNMNAKPAFLLMKEMMPLLKKNMGGAIITIAAKTVLHPAHGNAVYTAGKSALAALTLSVAEEGRAFQIRANCIVPAALQSPANLRWAGRELFETFTPLQDIADTIAFLVSENGRGITGCMLPMYHKMSA
jgi:NAD(P)-dependent dehydrogenase (short-subunit alcohol dehydrogenase family)